MRDDFLLGIEIVEQCYPGINEDSSHAAFQKVGFSLVSSSENSTRGLKLSTIRTMGVKVVETGLPFCRNFANFQVVDDKVNLVSDQEWNNLLSWHCRPLPCRSSLLHCRLPMNRMDIYPKRYPKFGMVRHPQRGNQAAFSALGTRSVRHLGKVCRGQDEFRDRRFRKERRR